MWAVILTDEFKIWLRGQEPALKKRIAASLLNLQYYGPALPRPYADTVKGSRFTNMKELRIQYDGHPVRAFYAFDPARQAIVLCAGDKTGDKQFYERMIALADDIFSQHLEELKRNPHD